MEGLKGERIEGVKGEIIEGPMEGPRGERIKIHILPKCREIRLTAIS